MGEENNEEELARREKESAEKLIAALREFIDDSCETYAPIGKILTFVREIVAIDDAASYDETFAKAALDVLFAYFHEDIGDDD